MVGIVSIPVLQKGAHVRLIPTGSFLFLTKKGGIMPSRHAAVRAAASAQLHPVIHAQNTFLRDRINAVKYGQMRINAGRIRINADRCRQIRVNTNMKNRDSGNTIQGCIRGILSPRTRLSARARHPYDGIMPTGGVHDRSKRVFCLLAKSG